VRTWRMRIEGDVRTPAADDRRAAGHGDQCGRNYNQVAKRWSWHCFRRRTVWHPRRGKVAQP
jgi:hypothetical protein